MVLLEWGCWNVHAGSRREVSLVYSIMSTFVVGIFGKAVANKMLQVNPSPVLFEGYKVGEVHQRTLVSLHQQSGKPLRLHQRTL